LWRIKKTPDPFTRSITWFKNGARVGGTIGSPKIQVVKRDGTDLIAEIAADPGAVGSGIVVHDSETDRMKPGEALVVIVSASIDSATRTFSKVVSRDAEAWWIFPGRGGGAHCAAAATDINSSGIHVARMLRSLRRAKIDSGATAAAVSKTEEGSGTFNWTSGWFGMPNW
jgi:hypothetical protein